ncbi:MAG: hypothetical protein ACI4CT_04185 [Lachnospiraceae bacterium]
MSKRIKRFLTSMIIVVLAMGRIAVSAAEEDYVLVQNVKETQVMYVGEESHISTVFLEKNGEWVWEERNLITYTSLDPSIAKVKKGGTIVAKKVGKTKIKCEYRGQVKYVKIKVVKLYVSSYGTKIVKNLYLPQGVTTNIEFASRGKNTQYKVVNKSIAKVETGESYWENKVTTLKEGKTKIKVKNSKDAATINLFVLPQFEMEVGDFNFDTENKKVCFTVTNKSDCSIRLNKTCYVSWHGAEMGWDESVKYQEGAVTLKSGESKRMTILSDWADKYHCTYSICFTMKGHKFEAGFDGNGTFTTFGIR